MLGGMLAGHDEGEGEIVTKQFATNEVDYKNPTGPGYISKVEERKFVEFYGMSSDTAMNKYAGGVASYRASEGRTLLVPYKGAVEQTVLEILGGLRSTMTYIGASELKHISKCTTFVRVSSQLNEVFVK